MTHSRFWVVRFFCCSLHLRVFGLGLLVGVFIAFCGSRFTGPQARKPSTMSRALLAPEPTFAAASPRLGNPFLKS